MTRHELAFADLPPSTAATKPRWLVELELLALGIAANHQRVIALSAPSPASGVTTISRALANVFAQSGLTTLIIDWTGPLSYTNRVTLQDRLRNYDYGSLRPPNCATLRLSTVGIVPDVGQLIEVLESSALKFDRLVFDLPPLTGVQLGQMNPLRAAASSDAFFLICTRHHEKRRILFNAVESAFKASVPISGLIMNDVHHSYIGNEVVRWANRYLRWVPPIKKSMVRLGKSVKELEEGTD
jgi:Mrp family chromosome partitioning ATPase